MTLAVLPLRFEFEVTAGTVSFPKWKAANVIRGAMGMLLRAQCDGGCDAPERCARDCAYRGIFEPRPHDSGPSGFADPPRPFVLRASELDGRTFETGESFAIGVNLFRMDAAALDMLTGCFDGLRREGLGPGRGKAAVKRLTKEPLEIPLSSLQQCSSVSIRFLTPTELKGAQDPARPAFGVVFARLRDRISALRAFYGPGPLPIDFRAMGERARRVELVNASMQSVAADRRSSRTGQSHGIGGWVGAAQYRGELGEFLPYLRAARWTGVGRQTAWGKGEIEVNTHCDVT